MSRLLRVALYSLLALYVVVVLGISALRFWIVPQLDRWREPIQQQLSMVLGTPIEFTRITGSWKGLYPSVELYSLKWGETAQNGAKFAVPYAKFTLSWSTLLDGRVNFKDIELSGTQLLIRRDADAQIYINEIALEKEGLGSTSTSNENVSSALDWLMQQPRVHILDSQIQWQDDLRNHAPVHAQGLNLRMQASPQGYQLRLEQDSQSSDILVLVDLERTAQHKQVGLAQFSGRFYARLGGDTVSRWAESLMLPDEWTFALRQSQVWLDIHEGTVETMQLDTELDDVQLTVAGQAVQAQQLHTSLRGSWQSVDELVRGKAVDPASEGVGVDIVAQNVDIDGGGVWQEALSFHHASAQVRWVNNQLHLDSLHINSTDFDLTTRGIWQASDQSEWGQLRLVGDIEQLQLSALHAYFPQLIDQDVRRWLAHSLVAGQLSQGKFVLVGDMEAFPFNREPERGYFYVGGAIDKATVDYAQGFNQQPSWPAVSQASGYLYIQRAGLFANFQQAQVQISPDHPVQAQHIDVAIPDMASSATLSINAKTEGRAADYLRLFTHSPLGGLLNHHLDQVSGEGKWQVPLQLHIPLYDPDQTTVSGHIHMHDSSLQLWPELPPLSQLTGHLGFSERGVYSDDLSGRWLGHPISLRDRLEKGKSGLIVDATVDTTQLKGYVEPELLTSMSGQTNAVLNISFNDSGQLLLSATSALEGMAITLPEPLAKPAEQSLPLALSWEPAEQASDYRLKASLGHRIKAELLYAGEGRQDKIDGFYAGALSNQKTIHVPESGLDIDLQYPALNFDKWYERLRLFSDSSNQAASLNWPQLRRLRIQSHDSVMLGMPFTQLTLTAHQPAKQRWRVDISSTEVAGNMQWLVNEQGELDGALNTRLQRLVLWEPDPTSPKAAADVNAVHDDTDWFDGELRLPELSVQIDQLRVGGLNLGHVQATGHGVDSQSSWRLSELTMDSPGLQLRGEGLWQLSGSERGLGLDARIQVDDLGQYFDFAGKPELMQAGRGEILTRLNWKRLPWSLNLENLEGEIHVDLNKGRLNRIQSRSARLLELLSLQSVGRLASLDLNLAALTREGFPFDKIMGTLHLNNAVLSTEEYSVLGPVGAIVIEGDVGLKSEQINVDAVVVPKVDISGAAVAAGIVMNPLLGVGAFITQWLMQSPLSEAMTLRYQVTGDWSEFHVTEKPIAVAP